MALSLRKLGPKFFGSMENLIAYMLWYSSRGADR